MTPIAALANRKITAIEANATDKVGQAVQAAWIEMESEAAFARARSSAWSEAARSVAARTALDTLAARPP